MRSLMRHAVHPPYNITPKKSKNGYYMVAFGIIIVILFCYSLFHSNDPQSSYLYNDISTYFPIQLSNPITVSLPRSYAYNNQNEESDSLEPILRPQRPWDETHNHIQNISHTNPTTTTTTTTTTTKHPHTNFDYWDFPPHSHSKPIDTSSAQHKGEYAMHIARVKWFNDKIKSLNKTMSSTSNLIDDFSTRCPIYKTNSKYCKWTPPISSLCNWTNTAIFWHSMHGTMIGGEFRKSVSGKHWMWEFAHELKHSKTCECPENVAFVFADNREKDMRLSEIGYKYCNNNCDWYRVANDYNPWDWYGKIGPLLDLIDNNEFKMKYEYVVLTDADDQTLVRSPINIVDAFEFYNASIVVAGEATSYPNWQGHEKGFENAVYPWSRHHQHLNAGGFMGKIVNMIPYLKWMKKDYNNFTIERADEIKERGRNFWRDQTVWRTMHMLFYPDIKIDSLARLWTRTDIYMYDL
eukprot:48493_1